MQLIEPLKLSVSEIGRISGESVPVIYDAIRAGHLKTFLVGRRRFAKLDAVRAWVDFLEKSSDAGAPVKYRARG